MDEDGQVYQVNLLEKLLVPLLCKLGNLVVDGGIWLNTQRPEWNDANNALVGQGVSMVTLNYLRRYVNFLQGLLDTLQGGVEVSYEVVLWLHESSKILETLTPELSGKPISDLLRYQTLEGLGQASYRYRQAVYKTERFSHKAECDVAEIKAFLSHALSAIEHTISTSCGENGLYQSYNLLELTEGKARVKNLYPMLEGQVAALSSGAISVEKSADVLTALFVSDIYRPDQKTFMLYPDRAQTSFLEKNLIAATQLNECPILLTMLKSGDERVVLQDVHGHYRFNANFKNNGDLLEQLERLKPEYPALDMRAQTKIEAIYEAVFNHQAFTGRSGGMFGFEGLGSVYWHMVSKLLLAAKENFYLAVEQEADDALVKRLGSLYYRIREGIGFNKSPEEYGAFPCDPYSHTPKHAGAQQPGMTGQVKEEILTRFGELGIHVANGKVTFAPNLLRIQEFITEHRQFEYLDVHEQWQVIPVSSNSLAFTWCQVPIVYKLCQGPTRLTIELADGVIKTSESLSLDTEHARLLFTRSGDIRQLTISLPHNHLFDAPDN